MARGKYRPSRELVLSVLGDHKPKSSRQVIEATGLSRSSVHDALRLCWKRGLFLRTKKPIYQPEKGEEILKELLERNRDLYRFEKMLEETGEKPK